MADLIDGGVVNWLESLPTDNEQNARLMEVIAMIAKMKVFPDDKINRFTLVCAINLAKDAIEVDRHAHTHAPAAGEEK